jgi:drug/metabolite transporter (DMT)-like permease
VDLGPLAIAGIRSLITALVMLLAAGVGRIHARWTGTSYGPPLFDLGLDQLLTAVLYAATVMLFVTATKWTTAANAILLQYCAPLFVALFSPLVLSEKIRRSDWIGLLIVLGGLALFFADRLTVEGSLGNILAISSGVTFAWVHLLLRRQRTGSPHGALILGNALAGLACLPFMFRVAPDTRSWLGLVFLGVFQLGAANLIYSRVIRHVRAVDASLILMLEPILNPIWVVLFYGERPGRWAIVGGAIVFVVISGRSFLQARDR